MFSWWCHEQDSLGVGHTYGSVGGACGDVNSKKIVQNRVCPCLFRKVMFFNPSQFTGGSEVRVLSKTSFDFC